MTSCAIKVCRNYKGRLKTTTIVTYHRIPTDPILRSKWIDIIRKSRDEDLWKPAKNSVVCSDHFREKDKYFVGTEQRRRLKKGVVPCKALFLSSIKSDGSCTSDEDKDACATGSRQDETSPKQIETLVIIENEPSNMMEDALLINSNVIDTSDAARTICRNNDDDENTLKETEIQSSDIDSIFDSPKRVKLRRDLRRKSKVVLNQARKIRRLQAKNRRLQKRNESLMKIVKFLTAAH